MKSRVILCSSIVISLLASIALNSAGVAFAVTEGDITVTANGDTWNTGSENQIDSPDVNIIINSNVDLNNLQCKLETADGTIINDFQGCLDTSSGGSVDYHDLNGEYTFTIKVVPSDGSASITLAYDFNTFGAGGGGAAAAPDIANTIEKGKVTINDGSPPWDTCPSGNTPNEQALPKFIKEIRYETLGSANLAKVLESDKQDIDLTVVVNFISGTAKAKITNDDATDFAVFSTHTECEYVAPVSSFSPETGNIPGTALNQDNSKLSNPPFRSCTADDTSAKYEINTKISKWEKNDEIKSIIKDLKNDQDLKLVITQFFKKDTGEQSEPWYMGQLIIEGGNADGKKIDLDLTGTDLHTSCLANFIA